MIGKDRGGLSEFALTREIRNEMHEKARLYNGNFGWQLISYPKGTRAILNVPLADGSLQHQFVMNTQTGKWCRFTGQNANCWEVFRDTLYFGGNTGKVNKADVALVNYESDLEAEIKMAFNFFGTPGINKSYLMLRPLITLDQEITPSLGVDVDFEDSATLSPAIAPALTTGQWDEVNWDEFVWGDEQTTYSSWNTIKANPGQNAAIRLKVKISRALEPAIWGAAKWGISKWGQSSGAAPPVFRVNGFYITMERAEFL
jgi:hypothetical protein